MKLLLPLGLVAGVAALLAAPNAGAAGGPKRTYEVTITNLSTGQPLTPPVFAAHRKKVDVYEVGTPASAWVREIAENGRVAPLASALGQIRGVNASGVASSDVNPDADGAGPILPGESRSWTFEARPGVRLFSAVSMIVCTNDGFTGLDAKRLPRGLNRQRSFRLVGYDAGTEMNTEDLDDLVPPCSEGATGTDISNPDLIEGGVIGLHDGIQGTGDLSVDEFGWDEPIARITIERTG